MTYLSELNVNELGTSGIITAVIAVLTLLGFIKGAVKLVFLLFSLAGGGYAAYWGGNEGLLYLQRSWPAAPESSGTIIAVVCGLLAFYFLSKIFGFLTNPFENSNFIARFAFGIPAAIVSLVAASGLVWLSLDFLKEKGAEGEIEYWLSQDDTDENSRLKDYPKLADLKHLFDSSTIGKNISSLYKTSDGEKHNLAKLLVIANTSAAKISELAKDERVRNVLKNPDVRRLMSDATIRKQIAENDVQGLLENKDLQSALGEKQLKEDLISIASEQLK